TAYPVADPADGRAPAPRDLFHAPTDGRAPIARVRTMPRDARPQPAPSFDAPASRDARTPTDGAPLDEPITIPHPDETAARGAEPVAAPRPAPQSTPTSRRRTSSLRETAPRETARPAQRVLDFDAARSRRSSAVDAPVETAETERFNADGEALPPLELLRCDAPRDAHDLAQLEQLGTVLKQALEDFGVAGELAGIQPGPVITVYEFQPAPGVKVSKIVNLQDDLALALKADSVRVDRIPGRSTLGIEVPNVERSVIRLGGLIADDDFQEGTFTLPMALGVDIYGKPVYADLAKMPHLLVAGATGAGKSVGLQSMITSILYQSTRHDVKFIFIDPKRVELGVYADIPHLKTEVVVDPKKAANALRWAVGEMERRYRLLASAHVRSIAYFNRLVADPSEHERLALRDGGDDEFGVDDLQPLPYTVIIIDELADLMMVAASDVETSIARLAQMARAVGIHLIVATQRPSVDVLTGTIKANVPCRIAYATATRHDSRTILDQVGAEKLLGRGDALFMPPGTSRIRRLHGAYITEEETAGLIRWLKRHGKPDLDLKVLEDPEEAREGATTDAGERDDPLYDDACRLAVRERMGSASFLQRRMRIGFSRASRLIDMMELDGILGPSQGSKPREVLVPPGYFDELDGARNDTDPDREL
ncbi:MAG: DNA translocase FtsK, partial [Acidobacteriota bacterium]